MSFLRRIARADAQLQREAIRPLDEAVALAAMWDEPDPEPLGVNERKHRGGKAGPAQRGTDHNVAISTRRHYEALAARARAEMN